MSFEKGFKETIKFLQSEVDSLNSLVKLSKTGIERNSYKAKLYQAEISLKKAKEIESEYYLCTHEHTIVTGDTAREVFCTNCNRYLYSCRL